MIVLVGGEKGGTGKTTISTNLAARRAAAGHDVLLIDTDRQLSASFWAQIRPETQPNVSCVQGFGEGLQKQICDLAKRYEDIIIDAGGRDSVELRAGLVTAEKFVSPLQASIFDTWTLTQLENLVATARGFNAKLDARIIFNRASTNPRVGESQEAQEALEAFEHLALSKTIIRDRIAFRKAAKEGLSVAEMPSVDTKAVAEIETLYREAFNE